MEIQLNLCIRRAPKHPSGKRRQHNVSPNTIWGRGSNNSFVCFGLQGTIRNMNDSCKQTSFRKCHADEIQL